VLTRKKKKKNHGLIKDNKINTNNKLKVIKKSLDRKKIHKSHKQQTVVFMLNWDEKHHLKEEEKITINTK
jgi:hypothetical protein